METGGETNDFKPIRLVNNLEISHTSYDEWMPLQVKLVTSNDDDLINLFRSRSDQSSTQNTKNSKIICWMDHTLMNHTYIYQNPVGVLVHLRVISYSFVYGSGERSGCERCSFYSERRKRSPLLNKGSTSVSSQTATKPLRYRTQHISQHSKSDVHVPLAHATHT